MSYYNVIKGGMMQAYLVYAVTSEHDNLLAACFYERSATACMAVAADIQLGTTVGLMQKGYAGTRAIRPYPKAKYEVKRTKITNGYDPYVLTTVALKQMGEGCLKPFLTTKVRAAEDFYSYLMENYNFPLIEDWKDYLLTVSKSNRLISFYEAGRWNRNPVYLTRPLDKIDLCGMGELRESDYVVIEPYPALGTRLMSFVQDGIKKHRISIDSCPNSASVVPESIDNYFDSFGTEIMEPLKIQMNPLTPLNGEVSTFTTVDKRLYPQQAAMVNAAVGLFFGEDISRNFENGRKKTSGEVAE